METNSPFAQHDQECVRSASEATDADKAGVGPTTDLPVTAASITDKQPVRACSNMRLWLLAAAGLALWVVMFATTGWGGFRHQAISAPAQLVAAGLLHLPYVALLGFLLFGAIERIGYYFKGRAPETPGKLPAKFPLVCIQLPMFNEDAVAARVIEASAAMRWPRDRLRIQVLDDSTDDITRMMVELTCARLQSKTGVTIDFIHRTDRTGYKAGALEAGRKRAGAEYIAIFDADFLPPPDYLLRTVPHFYDADGRRVDDLALVQAQWGHLNDDESFLTEAQALWVDDHHTLQQSWRSAAMKFVNFTGTAGIWRASAIEAAGGWRSASLVEDCELSFRVLFAGYRTKFVKEVVVPAELPQTFNAYRLQQKRWTQGWAQLQRLHFRSLLRYPMPWPRKVYLAYMMCISWQWPLWFSWIILFPFAMANGLSFATWGTGAALIAYALPPLGFALLAGIIATIETKHSYSGDAGATPKSVARRLSRIIPYLVVNAAMLAHHVCAFVEGLFGPLHCEFERTPKTASVTTAQSATSKRASNAACRILKRKVARLPYQVTEAVLLAMQLGWFALFLAEGSTLAAAGAAWLAICIVTIRLSPYIKAFVERQIDRNRGDGQ